MTFSPSPAPQITKHLKHTGNCVLGNKHLGATSINSLRELVYLPLSQSLPKLPHTVVISFMRKQPILVIALDEFQQVSEHSFLIDGSSLYPLAALWGAMQPVPELQLLLSGAQWSKLSLTSQRSVWPSGIGDYLKQLYDAAVRQNVQDNISMLTLPFEPMETQGMTKNPEGWTQVYTTPSSTNTSQNGFYAACSGGLTLKPTASMQSKNFTEKKSPCMKKYKDVKRAIQQMQNARYKRYPGETDRLDTLLESLSHPFPLSNKELLKLFGSAKEMIKPDFPEMILSEDTKQLIRDLQLIISHSFFENNDDHSPNPGTLVSHPKSRNTLITIEWTYIELLRNPSLRTDDLQCSIPFNPDNPIHHILFYIYVTDKLYRATLIALSYYLNIFHFQFPPKKQQTSLASTSKDPPPLTWSSTQDSSEITHIFHNIKSTVAQKKKSLKERTYQLRDSARKLTELYQYQGLTGKSPHPLIILDGSFMVFDSHNFWK